MIIAAACLAVLVIVLCVMVAVFAMARECRDLLCELVGSKEPAELTVTSAEVVDGGSTRYTMTDGKRTFYVNL